MAKVALLIAVSEYEAGLSPLPSTIKDVEAMQQVLENPDIGDFEVRSLLNPNTVEMQTAIEDLFLGRQRDDIVLLYFSGHGIKYDSGKLYFATKITRRNEKGELFKASTVSADFVHDIINDSRSRSRRQVIILDCCFSGAFANETKSKDDVSLDFQKIQLGGEGRAVLTSSTSTQYSFESIYTQYLVQGMETGEADENNDGFISVDELHQYVQRKVKENNHEMKPQIQAVIKEGYNIVLTKAPIHNRESIYLGIVKYYVHNGQISKIVRSILNEQQNRLEIESDKAAAIEEEVLKPYKEYDRKLQLYKEAFHQAVQQENPTTEQTRHELIGYQRLLRLTDEDINQIEATIIAKLTDTKKKYKFTTTTAANEKLLQFIGLAVVAIVIFGIGIVLGQLIHLPKANVANSSNSKSCQGVKNILETGLQISYGGQILQPGDTNSCKKSGIQAFASGNYNEALKNFQSSLQENPNDPEALIYLNNSKARQQGERLKISVSVPIDTDPDLAEEILRGVAQAQNEVNNNNGIKGKLLQVAIANDDEKPGTPRKIANALVGDPEILGVVGAASSNATLEAGDIYATKRLVAISPTSTAVNISNFSRYVFRTVFSDELPAQKLANYMVKILHKNNAAVFFNSSNLYSISLKDKFVTAVQNKGGKVSLENQFDLNSYNFDAENAIKQAINQDAVLMLISDSETLDKAYKVIQANNNHKLHIFGGDNVFSLNTLNSWGKQAEGMVVAVPWDISNASNLNFVNNSRKLWKSKVNWRTATAYDATQAIIAGLRKNNTREGLQQELHKSDFSFDGATGKIQFLLSGDRKYNPIFLVQVKQKADKKDEYEFVSIQP
ncbi:caspase, EACC1-associated type [Nostoc sp. DSM 114159]|jgi:branched-chain amino acid transport system substrate-binding protein